MSYPLQPTNGRELVVQLTILEWQYAGLAIQRKGLTIYWTRQNAGDALRVRWEQVATMDWPDWVVKRGVGTFPKPSYADMHIKQNDAGSGTVPSAFTS